MRKRVQFCLKMKELMNNKRKTKLLDLRKGKNTVSNEVAFSMLLSHFDETRFSPYIPTYLHCNLQVPKF